MTAEYEQALMGGVFLNSSSGAVNGDFKALLVIEAASLTNITLGEGVVTSRTGAKAVYSGDTVLEAASLVAGLYIPVPFTAITVASGVVFALGVAA